MAMSVRVWASKLVHLWKLLTVIKETDGQEAEASAEVQFLVVEKFKRSCQFVIFFDGKIVHATG